MRPGTGRYVRGAQSAGTAGGRDRVGDLRSRRLYRRVGGCGKLDREDVPRNGPRAHFDDQGIARFTADTGMRRAGLPDTDPNATSIDVSRDSDAISSARSSCHGRSSVKGA